MKRTIRTSRRAEVTGRGRTGSPGLALPRAVTIAALACLALPFGAVPSLAHPVSVDGVGVDWTGALPPLDNMGRIARDAQRRGEFVWRDATADTRAEMGPDPGLDLTEIRVTGDPQGFYVLARLAGSAVGSGAGAPLLQVAVDVTPGAGGAGQFALGDATHVAAGAAWEYLLVTRFASGAPARLLDPSLNDVPAAVAAALGPDAIEAFVPWTALGLVAPPLRPLRLSVALFRSDAADAADAVAGADPSRMADAVTDGGIPGSAFGTSAEAADATLDHDFEVHFGRDGEPITPLVISEIADAIGNRDEWIELYNASRVPLSLANWKVGDARTPGATGGMAMLPALTLEPGEVVLLAEEAARFIARFGFAPDAECESTDPSVEDLAAFTPWSATPELNLFGLADQVVLVDPSNTVVDVVTWGFASWPGVTAAGISFGSATLARTSPADDTDQGGTDFDASASATPGAPASVLDAGPAPGVPNGFAASIGPNPFRDRATVSLALPANTHVGVHVLDATGRRVRTLHRAGWGPGVLRLDWDGTADDGRALPSGVYFVSIEAGDSRTTLRTLRLR